MCTILPIGPKMMKVASVFKPVTTARLSNLQGSSYGRRGEAVPLSRPRVRQGQATKSGPGFPVEDIGGKYVADSKTQGRPRAIPTILPSHDRSDTGRPVFRSGRSRPA